MKNVYALLTLLGEGLLFLSLGIAIRDRNITSALTDGAILLMFVSAFASATTNKQ